MRHPDFPRPVVLAHRMLAEGYPENTLLSLEKAAEIGVDWIEFDVRTSADGVLFSMHDDRVDRTTDGSGYLSALTYSEIKRLNAGKGYGFGFVEVPTVEEILDFLSRYPRVIKAEMHLHNLEEPEKLVELLKKYNVTDRCYFNINMFGTAYYIRDELGEKDIKISLNVIGDMPGLEEFCREADISYLCVRTDALTPEFIQKIHNMKNGSGTLFVHSYPVNSPDMWEKMLRIGVDVIQTDYPLSLFGFLKEKGFDIPESALNGLE